jgi:hypothetical protein
MFMIQRYGCNVVRLGRGSSQCAMLSSSVQSVQSAELLDRLNATIANNTAKVDSLLEEYKIDIKKVKSKFDIYDKDLIGDVVLTRKKRRKGESLVVKFNCESEVFDFDDDDGYERILQSLERAEEKQLDYSDKVALGDNLEGIEIDVHIKKENSRLTFHCIASDKIVIQKVYFDTPLSEAGDKKELKRIYSGPKYVDLEEPIREELQSYLSKRLVDDFFSTFICNYSRIKREKEFILWAEHMKTIIS